MYDSKGSKVTRIKEFLHKLINTNLGPNTFSESPNPTEVIGFNDESFHGLEMPIDVPKAYLDVYVGPELQRFIIPTSYLRDPFFKVLLENVEEFGFDQGGALTILCDIETFKYLLQCMENHMNEEAGRNNGG